MGSCSSNQVPKLAGALAQPNPPPLPPLPSPPQSDLRLTKEKAKRKQAIIVRQEEEVGARDAALAAAQRELEGARHALEGARAQVC